MRKNNWKVDRFEGLGLRRVQGDGIKLRKLYKDQIVKSVTLVPQITPFEKDFTLIDYQ